MQFLEMSVICYIRFITLKEVIIISFAMLKGHSGVASHCAVHGSNPGRLLFRFSSPERSIRRNSGHLHLGEAHR